MVFEDISERHLNNYTFIANCQRHKGTKMNRFEFLENLRYVKCLRTRVYRSDFTFYITSFEELQIFQAMYHLVNSTRFEMDEIFERKVFMIGLPQNIYTWFKNVRYETIYKQIINWFAASYVFDYGKDKIYEKQLYEPIRFEMLRVVSEYRQRIEGQNLRDDDKKKEIYNAVSRDLTGSHPPEILSSFGEVHHEIEWGVNEYFDIDFVMSYMRLDNWEKLAAKKFRDPLYRVESNSHILEMWKMLFNNFDETKNNVYQPVRMKRNRDYIYVAREGDTNRYKIGWTTNPEIEKKRLSQMQTSNSNILTIIYSFDVTSKAVEKALHNYFSDYNIHREWFELSEKDIKNLTNPDWRLLNNFI